MRQLNSTLIFTTMLLCVGPICAAPLSSPEKIITFVEINDLHAHLAPHKDLVAATTSSRYHRRRDRTKIVERGGIARIATIVESIRKQNPNTLVLNVGDTFHGGVEAKYTLGNAIVPAVNALQIDVGVPGNWDFAYGPYVTRARYTPARVAFLNPLKFLLPEVLSPNFPNLAANITLDIPFQKNGPPWLPATLIKEVDGVRVGVLGLSSDIVPRMHEYLALGFRFLQGEQNYKKLINKQVKKLREDNVDIVVVMSELGIHKDYRLAQIIDPGVDIIFSAHTHEATFTPLTSASGAIVVEAGNDGYVGCMNVSMRGGKIETTDWRLIPVGHHIANHADVQKLVDEARAPFFEPDINYTSSSIFSNQKLTTPINTVIGHTQHFLGRTHALENNFNNAYADILRAITKTDIAIVPGFRFGASIAPPGYTYSENFTVADGAVTLEEAYRFFPSSFVISTGQTNGTQLKLLLEKALQHTFSADVFKQSGGWLDGFSGIDIDLDLSQPDGQRVVQIRHSDTGVVIEDQDVLSVTGCNPPLSTNNELCDFAGFTDINPALHPLTNRQMTSIDSLVYGLSQSPITSAARRNITDYSNTSFWPMSTFIQPLTGVSQD